MFRMKFPLTQDSQLTPSKERSQGILWAKVCNTPYTLTRYYSGLSFSHVVEPRGERLETVWGDGGEVPSSVDWSRFRSLLVPRRRRLGSEGTPDPGCPQHLPRVLLKNQRVRDAHLLLVIINLLLIKLSWFFKLLYVVFASSCRE